MSRPRMSSFARAAMCDHQRFVAASGSVARAATAAPTEKPARTIGTRTRGEIGGVFIGASLVETANAPDGASLQASMDSWTGTDACFRSPDKIPVFSFELLILPLDGMRPLLASLMASVCGCRWVGSVDEPVRCPESWGLLACPSSERQWGGESRHEASNARMNSSRSMPACVQMARSVDRGLPQEDDSGQNRFRQKSLKHGRLRLERPRAKGLNVEADRGFHVRKGLIK